MQQGSQLGLSVVMIVGTNRANAQGVLDALNRQSCADDLLEIAVFDCANSSVPVLQMPARFSGKYIHRPDLHFWRFARAQAAKVSSAPVVAFLENHCEHLQVMEYLLHSKTRREGSKLFQCVEAQIKHANISLFWPL